MYQPGYVPPQPTQPVTMGIGTGFKFGLGAVAVGLMVGVPLYIVYHLMKQVTQPTVAGAGVALPMVAMTAR